MLRFLQPKEKILSFCQLKHNKMTQETLQNMGYREIDGEIYLKEIIKKSPSVNFHEFAHPDLFDKFINAETEKERQEIKRITPRITNEEFSVAVASAFAEQLELNDWFGMMDGQRITFSNPLITSYFQLTNQRLELYLSLFAERLGVPSATTCLPSFVKGTVSTLKFLVKRAHEEKQMNDEN